ncbi:hypothetical protein J1N35_025601 [Gossypium stocksii]|uniref:Uncharacterized protein n=1 Tax=Gossypium stocksii TaxID=47602 RepID=A0A9D3V9A1_9ROSI|nr:hypothetical protein J1N35_025601 [Gossypium stocksii]
MDPFFSSVIQRWKPRLDAFTQIMGRSLICSVNGSKAVYFTTIHPRYRRVGTI